MRTPVFRMIVGGAASQHPHHKRCAYGPHGLTACCRGAVRRCGLPQDHSNRPHAWSHTPSDQLPGKCCSSSCWARGFGPQNHVKEDMTFLPGVWCKGTCMESMVVMCNNLIDTSRTVASWPACQVLERPEVWVMDTPGIMPPALRGHDQAMKLALVGEVPTPEAAAGWTRHLERKQLHAKVHCTLWGRCVRGRVCRQHSSY